MRRKEQIKEEASQLRRELEYALEEAENNEWGSEEEKGKEVKELTALIDRVDWVIQGARKL